MHEKTRLIVDGMTCSNCALGVSRILQQQGLHDVQVDFTTGDVSFEEVSAEQIPSIESKIRSLGYSVRSADLTNPAENSQPYKFLGTKQEKLFWCAHCFQYRYWATWFGIFPFCITPFFNWHYHFLCW